MFKKIYIEITNVCNLNCSFCRKDSRVKQFMSIDDYRMVIDKIKAYTKYVYFHVKGEPLMHPCIREFIDIARSNGLFVNLTSNGRLVSENVDIFSNVNRLNVSLHSYDDVSMLDDLLCVLDGVRCFKSLRLWNNKNNSLFYEILGKRYNVSDFSGNMIKLSDGLYLSKDVEFKWPDIGNDVISDTGYCLGLKDHIGILVDGTVVPCCLDSDGLIGLGNILYEDLDFILSKEKCKVMLDNFRCNRLSNELCKRCGYRIRFDRCRKQV